MTTHYLKIALRNLAKFRLQTIVCLTGLAVGMTCFALGTLWLRHIESFEDFFPNKENVYFATQGQNPTMRGFNYFTNRETGQDMFDSIPAVTDFCTIAPSLLEMYWQTEGVPMAAAVSGQQQRVRVMQADSAFFSFFGVKAEMGSLHGFRQGDVVLTRSTAHALFGDTVAIGQEVLLAKWPKEELKSPEREGYIESLARLADENAERLTVRAIIPDCPTNTQFRYDVLVHLDDESQGHNKICCYTFVRLNPHAELDSLVGVPIKLTVATPLKDMPTVCNIRHLDLVLTPITQLRSDYPTQDVEISTEYVRWFMLLGALVIACSLFNYIITMVSHLRRRGWEFSLRRVLGSSRVHILYMVSLETQLTFLLATVLAALLTWLLLPHFYEYSGIDLPISDIALRLMEYLLLVIICGMMLSALTAWMVMWTTQRNVLSSRSISPHSRGQRGTLGSIIQMALSMGIIFALVVMLRQVNMLMYSDELGFTHNNMGVLYGSSEDIKQRIAQSPLIDEMLLMEDCDPVFPRISYSENSVRLTDDRTDDYHIKYEEVQMDSVIARFFGFQLVAGELPVAKRYFHMGKASHEIVGFSIKNGNPEYLYQDFTRYPMEICVNEAMCRTLKVTPENAIGMKLYNNDELRVCGVLKDQYTQGCIVQPGPVIYYNTHDDNLYHGNWSNLAFRAKPGRTAELCDSIRQWAKASESNAQVYDCDEEFEKYITSEQMLIRILLAVGCASLLVCVIGTFSLVSLSLQQRRKEIAIRKVHGAKTRDIMRIFLRSHIISLFTAAVIAYPIAYIIMKHWLEGYAKQVSIDWWLIPATFICIVAVVLATIALKIWRAAKESTVAALNS